MSLIKEIEENEKNEKEEIDEEFSFPNFLENDVFPDLNEGIILVKISKNC